MRLIEADVPDDLVPLCPPRIIHAKDGAVFLQAVFVPQKIADSWGGATKLPDNYMERLKKQLEQDRRMLNDN